MKPRLRLMFALEEVNIPEVDVVHAFVLKVFDVFCEVDTGELD